MNYLINEHKYVKAYDYRLLIEIIIHSILTGFKDKKDGSTLTIHSNSLYDNVKISIIEDVVFNCTYKKDVTTEGLYSIDGPLKVNKNGTIQTININIIVGGQDDEYNFEYGYLLRKIIYHELNHFLDDYSDLKDHKKSLFQKLLSKSHLINYNQVRDDMFNLPDGQWQIPQLIYYLLIDTEFNAYVAQSYADYYTLDISSLSDIQNTPAYELYNEFNYTYIAVFNKYHGTTVPIGYKYFSDRYKQNKKINNIQSFCNWFKKEVAFKIEEYKKRITEIAEFYIQSKDAVAELNSLYQKYLDSKKQLKESKGIYTLKYQKFNVPVYMNNQHTSLSVQIDSELINLIINK